MKIREACDSKVNGKYNEDGHRKSMSIKAIVCGGEREVEGSSPMQ